MAPASSHRAARTVVKHGVPVAGNHIDIVLHVYQPAATCMADPDKSCFLMWYRNLYTLLPLLSVVDDGATQSAFATNSPSTLWLPKRAHHCKCADALLAQFCRGDLPNRPLVEVRCGLVREGNVTAPTL